MSDKVIYLKSNFASTSLITRQTARDLFEQTSHLPENKITLDFTDIQSASRSFFDELVSFESKWKLLGKEVNFVNISSQLIFLLDTVKNKNNTFSYSTSASSSSASPISF